MLQLWALTAFLLTCSIAHASSPPDWMTLIDYSIYLNFESVKSDTYSVSNTINFKTKGAISNKNIVLDFTGNLTDTTSVFLFRGNKQLKTSYQKNEATLEITTEDLPQDTYQLIITSLENKFSQTGISRPDTKEIYILSYFYPNNAKEVFPCFNDPSVLVSYNINVKLPESKRTQAVWSNSGPCPPNGNLYECTIQDRLPTYAINLVVTSSPSSSPPLASCWKTVKSSLPDQNMLKSTYFLKVPGLNTPSISGHQVIYLSPDLLESESNLPVKEEFEQCINIFEAVLKMVYGSKMPPKTWSDKWLTDSFAKYVAYEIFKEKLTTWKETPFYLTDISEASLTPSRTSIVTDGTSTLFDTTRIVRGTQLLRMLQSLMPTKLTDAINEFYNSKKGSIVSSDDFFSFLSKKVKDVPKEVDFENSFKNQWLKQTEFPHLNVRTDEGGTIVEQINSGDCWTIPVTYSGNNQVYWLVGNDGCDSYLNLTVPSPPYIFNPTSSGFYRVNYDASSLDSLQKILSSKIDTFDSTSRSHLLSDVIALGERGDYDMSHYLALFKFANEEKSAKVWELAARITMKMWTWMPGHLELRYKQEIFNQTQTIYGQLTFKSGTKESMDKLYLRSVIMNTLCYSQHPDCIQKAEEAFNNKWHLNDLYMYETIYCYGRMQSITKDEDWQTEFHTLYKPSDSKVFRHRALRILACPKLIPNENVIVSYLKEILTVKNPTILKEDVIPAMNAILSRHWHTYKAIDFFFYHFNDIHSLSREDKRSVIEIIGDKITTDDQLQRLNMFMGNPKSNDFTDELQEIFNRRSTAIQNYAKEADSLDDYWHPFTTSAKPTSHTPPTAHHTTNHDKTTKTTTTTTESPSSTQTTSTTSTKTTSKPGAANSLQQVNVLFVIAISFFLALYS